MKVNGSDPSGAEDDPVVSAPTSSAEIAIPAPNDFLPQPGANPRILVIDDTPAIHQDFRKILGPNEQTDLDRAEVSLFGAASLTTRKAEFHIDSAFQGQEGLALVQYALAEDRPYALAFVDIRMPPGWDGIDTIAQLWAVDPDLQVVISTAYSDHSWEDIAQRFGNTDNLVILKKPFDNIEVLQLAHALTKKWHLTKLSKERLVDLDRTVDQRTRELSAANERLQSSESRYRLLSNLGQGLSTAKTAREAARVIVEVADQMLG